MGGGLSNYSISSWPWFVKNQVLGIKLGLTRFKARAKELDNNLHQKFILCINSDIFSVGETNCI